jgi:hypothetical protein
LNNNFNLTPEQTQRLLNIAGQKLGADPANLQQQLESGRLNDLLGRMNPQQSARLNQLLQDPEALKQTLSSPAVRLMLNNLLGGKG